MTGQPDAATIIEERQRLRTLVLDAFGIEGKLRAAWERIGREADARDVARNEVDDRRGRSLTELLGQPPDSDETWREFMVDIAVRLDRVERQAIPVVAVGLRADLWPDLRLDLATIHGYPVVRLAADSPARWGVIT